LAVWEPWLRKSQALAGYAERDFAAGRYDTASFFAQQSAEILLKGLLLKRTGARPYTHSIADMLRTLSESLESPVPEEAVRCAEELELHYVQARYPDARVNEYRRWEAERAPECLRRIVGYVRGVGEVI